MDCCRFSIWWCGHSAGKKTKITNQLVNRIQLDWSMHSDLVVRVAYNITWYIHISISLMRHRSVTLDLSHWYIHNRSFVWNSQQLKKSTQYNNGRIVLKCTEICSMFRIQFTNATLLISTYLQYNCICLQSLFCIRFQFCEYSLLLSFVCIVVVYYSFDLAALPL